MIVAALLILTAYPSTETIEHHQMSFVVKDYNYDLLGQDCIFKLEDLRPDYIKGEYEYILGEIYIYAEMQPNSHPQIKEYWQTIRLIDEGEDCKVVIEFEATIPIPPLGRKKFFRAAILRAIHHNFMKEMQPRMKEVVTILKGDPSKLEFFQEKLDEVE
jgi:hypothetical protein